MQRIIIALAPDWLCGPRIGSQSLCKPILLGGRREVHLPTLLSFFQSTRPPRPHTLTMFRLPTIVSLLALAAAKVAQASPCVAFDSNFNLLVFGLDGKDWNAGAQDSWANGM